MKNKRYLFNCLKDPRQVTRLVRNRIERNPGDLAYEYSVMNALVSPNRRIFFNIEATYGRRMDAREIGLVGVRQ